MVKHHDFYVMVDFYTKYDQQFQFYRKSSTSAIFSPPSKTRRCFTQNKKEEVRLYYSTNGNFSETTKVFVINESTLGGNDQTSPSIGYKTFKQI